METWSGSLVCQAAAALSRFRKSSLSTLTRPLGSEQVGQLEQDGIAVRVVFADLLRKREQHAAAFLGPDARPPFLSVQHGDDRCTSPRQLGSGCMLLRHDREGPAPFAGVGEKCGAEDETTHKSNGQLIVKSR